jgi:hypothetical protein
MGKDQNTLSEEKKKSLSTEVAGSRPFVRLALVQADALP